jgi:hypothetical protein
MLWTVFDERNGHKPVLDKGTAKIIRRAAVNAGALAAVTAGCSEPEADVVRKSLGDLLGRLGSESFAGWLRRIMETERILAEPDRRDWLIDLVVDARNELVHEGRFSSRHDETAQWQGLVWLAASLLARVLGQPDGFKTLPDRLTQLSDISNSHAGT